MTFTIDENICVSCGLCEELCPVAAISANSNGTRKIDPKVCCGCGTCVSNCPNAAID